MCKISNCTFKKNMKFIFCKLENCTPPDVPEVPIERPRTRKRTQKANSELTARKRSKQQPSTVSETENQPPTNVVPRINESPPLTESERPDASMCLKVIIFSTFHFCFCFCCCSHFVIIILVIF